MRNFLKLFVTSCFVMAASIAAAEPIVTESSSTSTVNTTGTTTTTVLSPPSSAITPSINASNSDLCTIGVAGAVQTQILGVSAGTTVTDDNCERLKLSKTLYDMGMKVAAISVMCQDQRVFDAMEAAGTPCPYDGKIGDEAKAQWDANPDQQPAAKSTEDKNDTAKKFGLGLGGLLLLAAFL